MKKKLYATLLIENNRMLMNNFQKKSIENNINTNNNYSVKRLSNISNYDINLAKFSSGKSAKSGKEERKFSSSNQKISNIIDSDTLVNTILNSNNGTNINVIQSFNKNENNNIMKSSLNSNDNLNMNNKFNSSSINQRSNSTSQNKIVKQGNNNMEYTLNDLSFLNNFKSTTKNNIDENTQVKKNSGILKFSNNLDFTNLNSVKVGESTALDSNKDMLFMNFNLNNSTNNLMNINSTLSNNQVITNKSIDLTMIESLRNFNSSTSQNIEQRKNNEINNNLNNILNSQKVEDNFNIKTINSQLRGTVLEKGILVNTKGKYDEIKYRGQIAIELAKNFIINCKTLIMNVSHKNWNDNNCFIKHIPDNNIINAQDERSYNNVLRLLEYNINPKMIEPGADYKVIGNYKEGKYKLEIYCILDNTCLSEMKGCEMMIMILTKNQNFKVIKSTHDNYNIEDRKVIFNLKNCNNIAKFLIGMLFEANEENFVECVKISYRYMDVLPTRNNVEMSFLDENNNFFKIDVVKKCFVELKFIL